MNIKNIIKIFLIYGFLGWFLENLYLPNKRICTSVVKFVIPKTNCYIPILPVYGFAGIFIALLHEKYRLNFIELAILFVVTFTLFEYAIGYIGENYVCRHINTCSEKTMFWKYTTSTNVNGYVDLKHTFYWIVLGLVGYYIYPFVSSISVSTAFLIAICLFFIITYWKNNLD